MKTKMRFSVRVMLLSATFATLSVSAALAQVSVLTRSYDNQRTGTNASETILNQSNVNAAQFGKLFELAVDDQIFAQVLYVPNLSIAGGTHNVIFVATVSNTVYAFDADVAGSPLWLRNFNNGGRPTTNTEVGSNCSPYVDFSGNIGIIGTPVIDSSTNTMYFIARTVENGVTIQRLRAIDITTGNDRASNASVTISASGFDSMIENQRPSLALSQGVIYSGWASFCDSGDYHGWLMANNANDLSRAGSFNATPGGSEAGIWMSGFAPAVDSSGNLYVTTGNGSFDGNHNFGESLVKLSPSALNALDFFTPSNWDALNGGDTDFGSGPAVLLPGTNVVVAGGKEGKIFVVNTGNLGGVVTGDSQILQSFQAVDPTVVPGDTHHIHNGVATWNSPQGLNLYISGENDMVRLYRFNSSSQAFTIPATAVGSFLLPEGMPGSMFAVSANGSKPGTGVLWATSPLVGDANHNVVPGLLTAYNAENLEILWTSKDNSADDTQTFSKGAPPTVANGKVYIASLSNLVSVYGLKNTTAPDFLLSSSPNSMNLTPGSKGTSTISVGQFNGFNGSVNLSASGLPSGVTALFSPSSTTGISVLTLTTNSSAAVGTARVTIIGTSGTLSHTTAVDLKVSTGGPVSINCGGPASGNFIADADFNGGSTASTTAVIDTSAVSSPVPPQGVFQTERFGTTSYTLGGFIAGARENVALYFAEFFWTASGQRLFNVSINGTQVLSDFDIFAAAGAANKGIQKNFATTADNSGQVVIQFSNGSADQPKCDGISVTNASSENFSMSSSPSSLSITRGSSGSSTITVSPSNGFNGSVSLSASGLPSGVTASFNPKSTKGTSRLTLTASKSATVKTAKVTIKGTSGSLSHTTTISLTVRK